MQNRNLRFVNNGYENYEITKNQTIMPLVIKFVRE